MSTYTQELARIASDVDVLGIAANETAIAMVVARARAAGVDPLLLSVLSDTAEPEIARARAFGRVATALAATVEPPRHLELVASA
ncbi:MAG TPA: hypothetical protein VK891_17285 [Euzebyales bacterium]|nr:hypothetical protein [Euzebyales bacterium]